MSQVVQLERLRAHPGEHVGRCSRPASYDACLGARSIYALPYAAALPGSVLEGRLAQVVVGGGGGEGWNLDVMLLYLLSCCLVVVGFYACWPWGGEGRGNQDKTGCGSKRKREGF